MLTSFMHLHSHSDVKLPPECSRFLLAGCIMHISTVSKLLRKGFLTKGSKGGTVLYVAMSCRYDFVFSCIFSLHMTHDSWPNQKDVMKITALWNPPTPELLLLAAVRVALVRAPVPRSLRILEHAVWENWICHTTWPLVWPTSKQLQSV